MKHKEKKLQLTISRALKRHKLRIPQPIEEKIIHLRKAYIFGADMIVCHLQRNHDIKISRNGCYQVLLRNKSN